MDTNGNGNGNGAERGDDWPPPVMEALPEAARLIAYVVSENPALKGHEGALFKIAGYSARLGYQQSQRELKAKTLPVRFTEGAVGVATLEGEEARALLASFGLSTEAE